MKFPRIYADEQGETHIGVRDVPEHEARVGPPPNPVGQMTETEAVSTFVVISPPAGIEVPSLPMPLPCLGAAYARDSHAFSVSDAICGA